MGAYGATSADGRVRRAEEMLQEHCGVTDQTLNVCEYGWGTSMETLETILYVITGMRDFDQLEEYIEEEL